MDRNPTGEEHAKEKNTSFRIVDSGKCGPASEAPRDGGRLKRKVYNIRNNEVCDVCAAGTPAGMPESSMSYVGAKTTFLTFKTL